MAEGFAARPGAVGTPPQHYGSPLVEQRALSHGEAVVDLSHHGVVTVTGPDRLSWLDSVTSQSIKGLRPGESAETLLLDPNGRIEHAIRLIDDGETVWLLVDEGEAATLAAWLERMRFMMQVEVVDRSDQYATIGTLGDAEGLPHAVSGDIPLVWRDPWPSVVAGGWQYAHVEEHPGAQWTWSELLIERARLGEYDAIPAAGLLASEALRAAAWRPAWATEVDEKAIPNEYDWLRSAVHLSKGCYRGQETVAKIHNLGHPPRRLVFLHVDGSAHVPPEHGDPIYLVGTDTEVGRVTTGAHHWELGPIALALVKRSVDPQATLEIDRAGERLSAAQEVVVPTDAGATVDVPRLPRLGSVRR